MKKALITGITGQDGSYLAEFLLENGYDVYGIKRRSSSFNTDRIDHIYQDPHVPEGRFHLVYGDLNDASSLNKIIRDIKPDEIYNLAAQSHVRVSFDIPEYTAEIGAIGALRLLEAIRETDVDVKIKFYQASSSEMFGNTQEESINETTPFRPRSPYAISKVFAYWMAVNYREAYDIFACNGILFNHESPRRGETFVTRKITMALANIIAGKQDKLYLGNLDAKRDWGYAKDYVEAMWLMMQHDKPDDYVVATGVAHSVREFLEEACKLVGIELEWQGRGVDEIGIDRISGKTIVEIDPRYFRPTEVDFLLGDSSKMEKEFGWKPKTTFKELVEIMVEADLLTNRGREIPAEKLEKTVEEISHDIEAIEYEVDQMVQ